MPASTKGDFLLRVKGESMIDAGILDGDLVIVQRAQDARNGEIVVALAGDDESRRRGDGEDVLPRGRSHQAAARELEHGADLRARTCRSSAASWGSSGSCRHVNVASLHRTLDQELAALLRGASLECLTCGEFVMHAARERLLPRVREPARRRGRVRGRRYDFGGRPGDRGRLFRQPVEESPDTAGQDAGASQAAKADGKWNRKQTAAGDVSPETPAVRVKRWGKSPPASRRRGGSPNPVRCKANRARHRLPAEGPG